MLYEARRNFFKVSEIAGILKKLIEENFFDVRIQGEVSGLKESTSGHIYFSLKDDAAVLNAVCWRNVMQKAAIHIEEGMEVICDGKLSTYPGRSNYQLVVSAITISGTGSLLATLEKRKNVLAAEGLFDVSSKKKLPKFPKTIGVITSLNGVVIRDILHRISDRFPLEVLIWNTAVQGNEAVEQISQAIAGFNSLSITVPELIIIARGGGSIEDLWCFNEEIMVRSIANSKIPIISAIGHETDFTLADFAADLRAPTPTAAVEFAVPVLHEIKASIKNTLHKSVRAIRANLESMRLHLTRYDNVLEKITMLQDQKMRDILEIERTSKQAVSQRFTKIAFRLALLEQLLSKYNQANILKRGFAIIRKAKDHSIITSKALLTEQGEFLIEMHDGNVTAKLNNKD